MYTASVVYIYNMYIYTQKYIFVYVKIICHVVVCLAMVPEKLRYSN